MGARHAPSTTGTLQSRVWTGQFSSEAHLERILIFLNEFIVEPEDWIIIADNDEFQDYGVPNVQ